MPTDICVPYTHVQTATYLYLLQHYNTPEYPVTWIDVADSPWAYNHYLSDRWYAGHTFINLEHDIVPWPGAIEALVQCPNPWCFHGYRPNLRMVPNGGAPFGLVKLGDVLITATKDVWKRQREDEIMQSSNTPWKSQDIWLFQEAMKVGIMPHQHYPAVLNAHPPPERFMDWNAEGVLKCPRPSKEIPLSDQAYREPSTSI